MTTVLTRQPAISLMNCEVTHINTSRIDIKLALEQHSRFCQTLKHFGIEVRILPPLEAYPDSVFIEDNAIILKELAVCTSMGIAARQGEPEFLFPILSQYRHIEKIHTPATIEGGDVLQINNNLYVGLSSRTNFLGIRTFRKLLELLDYTIKVIEVNDCLHLKTACTPLDKETLLVNPQWIDTKTLKAFRLIHVPLDEPFGANVLRLPQGILASANYPKTLDLLNKYGYSVEVIELGEFSKAEGGLTCLSLIID